MQQAKHDTLNKISLALASLMVVVTSSWVADGLKGECLFEPWIGSCGKDSLILFCRTLFSFIAFGVSAWVAFRLAVHFLPVKHLEQSNQVTAHKVLITSLSPFDCTYSQDHSGQWIARGKKRDGEDISIPLTGNIEQDIEGLGALRPRDQQFLRALSPHISNIEHLVLLASDGPRGSFNSRHTAQTLAGIYLPPNVSIHTHVNAVDFEDIEAMQRVMENWIRNFKAAGITDRHIMIDVTGGFKTASIAAALTTLHSQDIQFQYVQTEQKDDKPLHAIGFNVVSAAREKAMDS